MSHPEESSEALDFLLLFLLLWGTNKESGKEEKLHFRIRVK